MSAPWSRLFDDQVQARIRLETEAVKLILSRVRAGDLKLITSPAHLVEVAAIKNLEERESLKPRYKASVRTPKTLGHQES
jgi:hypothetical protein